MHHLVGRAVLFLSADMLRELCFVNAEATRGQASQGAPALGKLRLEAPALRDVGLPRGGGASGKGCCGEGGARVPQGSPLPPPACASRLLALLPPRHRHFQRKTSRSLRHFSTGVQTLGPAHLVFQFPRGWPVNPNGSLGTGGGGLADGGEEGCRLRTRQLRPRSIDCGSPAGPRLGPGTHASAARSRCVGPVRTPAPGCRPPPPPANPTHPGLISWAPCFLVLSQAIPNPAARSTVLTVEAPCGPGLGGCPARGTLWPPSGRLPLALPRAVPSADGSSGGGVCRKREITPALETQPLL